MFKDKKIIVVGMARSGISAAKALIEAGADVTVNDSKADIEIDFEVKKDLGGPPSSLDYDIMVLSPGVPTDLPFVLEAKSKMKVIGALEVGYLLSKGRFYGITGTNGKTTTTTLTYEIFKAGECDAYAVGNIGNSVASVALETTEKSHLITEVSSFQLESIDQFKVHIAAILNFAPDHLNRHKTMENYIDSKCRIAENQTSDDYLLLNYDNEGTRDLDTSRFKSKVIYFSKSPLKEGFYIEDDHIVADFNGKIKLLPLSLIHVPGDHNLENILAAIGIAYLAGVSTEAMHKAIDAFRGVAHRIEYVGTHQGIKCYNDSKGTNPDSSIVAVKAMTSPTLLIAGGMDKGSEFDEFVSYFKHVKSLILLGETKEKIAEAAKKTGFDKIIFVETMDQAVEKAFEIGDRGDILLLSPACASWDMYPSFEVRGEHFKSCLEKY
ncbi:UDP-N-acetylmuramoyl-L-alanine--D-glutamate ligase [Acidaminobacter sp. JC074]|uniref:UDP-N-acetylmuramoyl-L-alanine--D-glutamate ligase n=1 Tax=Acidaminobacter sp. JC074 TaxID=2530199 RepID=UPI001F0F6F2F|nr:UDP-N-acetylmuramoyl-L-alanine--D-glutamate ligase [Acidaminobacter sp. JC074]MCH4890219.1 UDP-N-acetylmuramoyl-L-alanine--D-glutamate ligase [Acidaminobacter sp. JC074]